MGAVLGVVSIGVAILVHYDHPAVAISNRVVFKSRILVTTERYACTGMDS